MSEASPQKTGVSRRDAIKAGTLGCSGAVVVTSAALNGMASPTLPIELWQSLVGDNFKVLELSFYDHQFEKPVELRLVDATDVGIKPQPGQSLPNGISGQSISLVFEGDMRTDLPSATYKISHPKVGKLDVLLSQIIPISDAKAKNFEAIIG